MRLLKYSEKKVETFLVTTLAIYYIGSVPRFRAMSGKVKVL